MQNRLVPDKGEEGDGGMDWEFGMSRYNVLYREQINNKSLDSIRKYIQYPMITMMEKNVKKAHIYIYIYIYIYVYTHTYIYICITKALCCTAEINTTFEINYTSIK